MDPLKLLEILGLGVSLFAETLFTSTGPTLTAMGDRLVRRHSVLDVQHYDIHVSAGEKKIQFLTALRARVEKQPSRKLLFILNRQFTVTGVFLESQKVSFEKVSVPQQVAQLLFVKPNQKLSKDQTVMFRFQYEGQANDKNTQGELSIFDLWYPVTGVEDFFTAAQRVEWNGRDLTVLGNGKEKQKGVWELSQPVPIMNMVWGDFKKLSRPDAPIDFYYPAGISETDAQELMNFSYEVFVYLEKLTGLPFPYLPLKVVVTDGQGALAYAGPGTVVLHNQLLSAVIRGKDSFPEVRLKKLLAHEIAHQFFGNLASPKLLNGGFWLVEGLSEYLSLMYVEHAYGKNMFELLMLEEEVNPYRKHLKSHPEKPITQASYFDPEDAGLFYHKGSLLFHELREILGDHVFVQCLQEYLREFQGKFVDVDDFQEVCEKAAEEDLSWFFRSFVRGNAPIDTGD